MQRADIIPPRPMALKPLVTNLLAGRHPAGAGPRGKLAPPRASVLSEIDCGPVGRTDGRVNTATGLRCVLGGVGRLEFVEQRFVAVVVQSPG
jgi:hypothetical protein